MKIDRTTGRPIRLARHYNESTEDNREAIESFLNHICPEIIELDGLRKQLALIRGEAQELRRRGLFGRDLSELNFEAVKLSGRIDYILSTARLPG